MAADLITAELRQVLRRLKLSPMLDTLPERLVLARQNKMAHQDFLELVLADEISRRDRSSAETRAKAAKLDPTMALERWDETTAVTFDLNLWSDLVTLRFVDDSFNVLVLGPVGVGKTFMATALGHVACRKKHSVVMARADRLLKKLKATRLDATYEAEMRKLIRCDLLILDDFCIQAMDAIETQDIYEIVVERHRKGSMVVVSNREPAEWISSMADPLLAQSAVDRLLNSAYELVIEGESYRKRQKPGRPTK